MNALRTTPVGWRTWLALALLTSAAQAATITSTRDFRLNSANPASLLQFDAFDPALGFLDAVEVSFTATRRHAWGIWNVSGAEGAIPYELSLEGTTLTLDGNAFGFSDLQYGPASTPTLASVEFPDFLNQFLAGQTQFLAGNEPDFGAAFRNPTQLTSLSGSFTPLSFAGVLDLSHAFDPGTFTASADGAFVASLVDIYGTATVSYRYSAATIPDAGPGVGLLAALWGSLFVVVRFQKRRLAQRDA